MTAATTTLNPGVGGDLVLADTLTTVDGAAAPTNARAQFAKFGWGGANEINSVTLSKGLPVVAAQGTPTSRSGTITTGGTAQQLAAGNDARTGVLVQNNSTADIRVAVTTTASTTSGARVAPGQMLVLLQPFCGTGAISIWGATTGQEFHALETV